MEWLTISLIGGGVLILLLIFEKYVGNRLKGLTSDLIDLVLSSIDEPFGGAVMIDWGDWIAAIWIFLRERKVTSTILALIVALEAANFIPGTDIITNFIPMATIVRFIYAYYPKAFEGLKRFEDNVTLAIKMKLSIGKKEKDKEKEFKELINKKDNPRKAIKEEKKEEKVLKSALKKELKKRIERVQKELEQTQNQFNNISEDMTLPEDLPQEQNPSALFESISETVVQTLQQSVSLLEKELLKECYVTIEEAERDLKEGVERMNQFINELNEQLNNQYYDQQ